MVFSFRRHTSKFQALEYLFRDACCTARSSARACKRSAALSIQFGYLGFDLRLDFLIGGASVIYWFVLLVALCSRLGLNTALWLVVGVIGGPVGVAIAHAYVFPKATGYFANGGT